MNQRRRVLLRGVALGGGVAVAAAAGLLRPRAVLGAWNREAFETKGLDQVLSRLGMQSPSVDDRIEIDAPQVASNGSVVPVKIRSDIPGTEFIAVFGEKNPFPLLGIFEFSNGALAFASMRIKLRQTSNVNAVIKANGKYYTNSSLVKVTIGGCGG